MEILAPLRNSRGLLSRVLDAGADAVYFGVRPVHQACARYSLLWTPLEFDPDAAREVIRATHSAGRRAYVTLNVPYPQSQLHDVVAIACRLIDDGAHALIVSDPGLMAHLSDLRPAAELHVSIIGRTANAESAMFYKKLGAKRVILERFLSVDEIRSVKERSGVDVEVFIYGNFCFFYHGGCRISSYFYGEQCLGPCMEPYRIRDLPGAGERPFRSKPINGYGVLAELYHAGVASIKIEGRQKSTRYILDTVRALRRAVDCLEQGRPLPRADAAQGLFLHPPAATEGFFRGAPFVGDTIDTDNSLAARLRYFRTYLTAEGLPVALKMRKTKKEAKSRIEERD